MIIGHQHETIGNGRCRVRSKSCVAKPQMLARCGALRGECIQAAIPRYKHLITRYRRCPIHWINPRPIDLSRPKFSASVCVESIHATVVSTDVDSSVGKGR